MSCGSSSISDTRSWGIWAPSSLPNPPTGARAAARQQWQHCLHPPDLLGDAQSASDSQMGSMGEKYTSRKAGTLDCLCHMEVERLKIIPSAVSWMDGGHLPLLPGVLCHLQLQRWGEPQLPRAQQSPAQWACGLQENTVPGRVTLSHCDTTSFSSSLAKQYKPCYTLK